MMEIGSNSQMEGDVAVAPRFAGENTFWSDVEKAKVVSFDFFDTLYIRPLAHPEDAFEIIGKKFGIDSFSTLRRSAQAEAFRRMAESGKREITLEGIYSCLAVCGTPASVLMQAEYDLELALVEPNPEVMPIFKELLDQNVKVVITSDMYLPGSFFKAALRPYGLDDVPLFISSDCNATKRDSGELFRLLAARLNVSVGDVLHIGDNEQGDVVRPRQVGVKAFHYRSGLLRDVGKGLSLATSIAYGLLYTEARSLSVGSFSEVGFVYGGTSNLAFLQWIKEAALRDRIDHVLFMSRDGYSLERMTSEYWGDAYPTHSYFLGSRTAFTLASVTSENFSQFIPFFLSGADGLAPAEVLERIGVAQPSDNIMRQLGLGRDVKIGPVNHERVSAFIYAYRWEILKVCRRNRIALRRYLKQLGLQDNSRVALVDVGWSGTTQEAFERAVTSLMDLDVYGYYFCLADTPERKRRSSGHRMDALIGSHNTPAKTVSSIYANRVVVEMLFSAPHPSVIGWEVVQGEIRPVFDRGRGYSGSTEKVADQLSAGIDSYAKCYARFAERLDTNLQARDLIAPILELINDRASIGYNLLSKVEAFDAWGSSSNHKFSLKDYL